MPDHWRRALLRATLRELGYDAIGSTGVREAMLTRVDAPQRGPLQLVVLDQEAIDNATARMVTPLLERLGAPATILLARTTVSPPAGPWRRVLRRPMSVDEVVRTVKELLPLPPQLQHPVDESVEL